MRVLEMNFLREDGKTAKIAVSNAREDLSAVEIKTAMEGIIAKDVFAPSGLSLVGVGTAKVVITQEEAFDLE